MNYKTASIVCIIVMSSRMIVPSVKSSDSRSSSEKTVVEDYKNNKVVIRDLKITTSSPGHACNTIGTYTLQVNSPDTNHEEQAFKDGFNCAAKQARTHVDYHIRKFKEEYRDPLVLLCASFAGGALFGAMSYYAMMERYK